MIGGRVFTGYLFKYVNSHVIIQAEYKVLSSALLPFREVVCMNTGYNDIEDLFEDCLTTIFGDVTVSHGEPGSTFIYPTKTKGYLKPLLLRARTC